jgi:hypothetical protein
MESLYQLNDMAALVRLHENIHAFLHEGANSNECNYINININDSLNSNYGYIGQRGSIDGWGTMQQAGRSRVRFPMISLAFYLNLPNLSSRTMPLCFIQPLTEI